jgi:hypothetical protein
MRSMAGNAPRRAPTTDSLAGQVTGAREHVEGTMADTRSDFISVLGAGAAVLLAEGCVCVAAGAVIAPGESAFAFGRVAGLFAIPTAAFSFFAIRAWRRDRSTFPVILVACAILCALAPLAVYSAIAPPPLPDEDLSAVADVEVEVRETSTRITHPSIAFQVDAPVGLEADRAVADQLEQAAGGMMRAWALTRDGRGVVVTIAPRLRPDGFDDFVAGLRDGMRSARILRFVARGAARPPHVDYTIESAGIRTMGRVIFVQEGELARPVTVYVVGMSDQEAAAVTSSLRPR